MGQRRFAVVGALCGTVVLASWVAGSLVGFGSLGIENTGAQIEDTRATVISGVEHVDASPASAIDVDVVAVADMESGDATLADPGPLVVPGAPPVLLASVSTADPVQNATKPAASFVETPDECIVPEICIDDYLWSLYQRTPKVDTMKVTERIKVTVKKKGKTRTVIKTTTKYVEGNFTWKDPIAAQKAGMSLKDYVIGGMDRGFKLKLYPALRAMDDAGLMPGITSAFRDDYRQSIISGNKAAASDSSYHGGSRRGGYGYGLAADLVSVRGDTRMQRYLSSRELWKWIDAHEQELGIGRPYLDRDAPHVGPIDGQEYASKRGRANVQKAGLPTENAQKARLQATKHQLAERNDPGPTQPAEPARHPSSLPVR